ncbi:uncharacterized protein Triagg1_2798 [Trichoderma aggressivum f. europaeum]|uniref:Secreted protein n=1 Tax=Trichoderma aggressivum f. europaeum TaxID=173218 RepID=A0AAE1JEJ4_9HYPO|nr:hypothetical protein Triagg1_2798 [Trichoderma aggressivum f. europaeum]
MLQVMWAVMMATGIAFDLDETPPSNLLTVMIAVDLIPAVGSQGVPQRERGTETGTETETVLPACRRDTPAHSDNVCFCFMLSGKGHCWPFGTGGINTTAESGVLPPSYSMVSWQLQIFGMLLRTLCPAAILAPPVGLAVRVLASVSTPACEYLVVNCWVLRIDSAVWRQYNSFAALIPPPTGSIRMLVRPWSTPLSDWKI